jgi:hypothetical protein
MVRKQVARRSRDVNRTAFDVVERATRERDGETERAASTPADADVPALNLTDYARRRRGQNRQ